MDEETQKLLAAVEKMREQIAPALSDLPRDEQAMVVSTTFPQLAHEEVATELMRTARHMAEQLERPEWAGEPWFWMVTHIGMREARAAPVNRADRRAMMRARRRSR